MTKPRTVADDVTVADLERDPYPIYARLRAEAPVSYVPAVDLWLVTRWDDVRTVASDPAVFSAEMDDSPLDVAFGGPQHPDHGRPGPQGHPAQPGREVRARTVRGYIDDLGRADRRGAAGAAGRPRSVDLLAEYFEPISVLSLGRVLGLGHLDADTLRRWFHGLHQGAINFERDPDRARISDAVAAEIDETLAPVLARLTSADEDSTIAHMLFSGVADGGRRDVATILPTLKVIILGGMQEPGHGAASTTYALLSDPEALARVQADLETMVPVALEEGLRWMSPIGTQTRQVRREVELGGATLPVGARVGSVVASANRDESVFPDPDRYSLDRRAARTPPSASACTPASGTPSRAGRSRSPCGRLLEAHPDLRLDDSVQTSSAVGSSGLPGPCRSAWADGGAPGLPRRDGHRQPLDAVDEVAAQPLRLAGEGGGVEPRDQLLQRHRELELGEERPEAEVRTALAEGQQVHARAVQVEDVGSEMARSSRLPLGNHIASLSPARICTPATSTSRVAVRRMW
jgi:cytochrome P450